MERVNIVNKTTGGRTSTTRRALALGFLAPEWAEEDTEVAAEIVAPTNPGAGDPPETAAITSRPRRRAATSAETRKG